MKKHKEWGNRVLSMQLKNECKIKMSFSSVRRYFRQPEKKKKEKEKIRFYEMKRAHSMHHGDVMEVILPNGQKVYQCSFEDDFSRGYMGVELAEQKDSRIAVNALIDGIEEWQALPSVVHYDNGSECKNALFKGFLRNLNEDTCHKIKLIHTKVNNPKGNGKKERAHKDDRRDFWNKNKSSDLSYIKKKYEKYKHWRNYKKGHMALKGNPSITRLKQNKKKKWKFTRQKLENLARAKIGERLVRPLGVIYMKNKIYYVDPKLAGEKVELWETLKGLEVRKGDTLFYCLYDYWETKNPKS